MIAPFAIVMLMTTPPDCPAAATVEGSMAGPLTEALARRGITVPAPEGCETITVRVEPADTGITLARDDAEPREIPDLETGALLIETWVRAELIDPLLEARLGPRRPPPPPAPSAERLLTVGAGVDGAWSDDNATWVGARANGCIELGLFCPGLRLRFGYDPGLTGSGKDAGVWRISLGAMATTDLILGDSRVGLGAGVTVVRIDGQDGVDDVRGGPLFELNASHAFPLNDTWAIDVGAAVDLALWPRHGRDNASESGLPGLPQWTVLGGIGLRGTGL